MSNCEITGRIHSFQSLGTVDGPGVRAVVFMQGCPLRCGCCHNPDTWDRNGGEVYTISEVLQKLLRFRSYFGQEGGITVSGGEPLLQASFTAALFAACHHEGIHTCLDTSGALWNHDISRLLEVTDRVLLDMKYTTDEYYRRYVGCERSDVLHFLSQLQARNIPVTLRQVIIPTLNDTKDNIHRLRILASQFPCVDSVELLPFRKLCQIKYNAMGLPFRFAEYNEPTLSDMQYLEALLFKTDA